MITEGLGIENLCKRVLTFTARVMRMGTSCTTINMLYVYFMGDSSHISGYMRLLPDKTSPYSTKATCLGVGIDLKEGTLSIVPETNCSDK